MRRKDRSLPKDEALSLLENGEYGILSTVGQDKEPYGTPLSYALGDNCIFIHGAASMVITGDYDLTMEETCTLLENAYHSFANV